MNVISSSFGKDSMASILLAHIHRIPIDEVIFVNVMFDKETSAEPPEHIDFVYNKAIPFCESIGMPVKVLTPSTTFCDFFVKERTQRSKYFGKIYGFPLALRCEINGLCKRKVINEYKSQNPNVQMYVGIAVDEVQRLKNLQERGGESLLANFEYTEQMAKELCEQYGMLSPIYNFVKREGCWFCPAQNKKQIVACFKRHPDLWEKYKQLYYDNKDRLIRTNINWNLTMEDLIEDLER